MDSPSGANADTSKPVNMENGTGNGAPPPSHFTFSTRDLPAEGKFETWRDLWMRRLCEIDMSTDSPESFEGEIDMWSAGLLSIARIVGVNVKSTMYDRTASLARNGNDDFSLTLCGHGLTVNSLNTGTAIVSPGGGFFLSHDRWFTVKPSDNGPTYLLRIDRKTLLELMPRGFDVATQTFSPGSNILELIKHTVPLITNKTEPTTQGRRETVGRQIIDLVALLFNPTRDGRALIEARGLKAARQGAVLQAIDRHFARPGLSAEDVGRALGMSGRQVHRMLEDTTKTFYEHLLERRLVYACELLTEPRSAHLKIVDIAYEAGFKTVAHFNHAFRARFGETPTAVRGEAAVEHTLRVLRGSVMTGI